MKFSEGEKVKFTCVDGLTGIVRGIYSSQSGFRYEVSYWTEGKHTVSEFHENELEEYKELMPMAFGKPHKDLEKELKVATLGDKIV